MYTVLTIIFSIGAIACLMVTMTALFFVIKFSYEKFFPPKLPKFPYFDRHDFGSSKYIPMFDEVVFGHSLKKGDLVKRYTNGLLWDAFLINGIGQDSVYCCFDNLGGKLVINKFSAIYDENFTLSGCEKYPEYTYKVFQRK